MQLTKKQEEGLKIAVARYRAKEKCTVISGYAGSGKAQPNSTLIPTPNGYKRLGKIQVGDLVFNCEGEAVRVLGVYPQGEKEVYKVSFADGRVSYCAGDHLWTILNRQNKKMTLTTEEILNKGVKDSSGYKYGVPRNGRVNYSYKDLPIDPYVLGVFLGDGCCKERYLTLSSETDEIPNEVGRLLNATASRNSLKNYSWTFEWKNAQDYKYIEWVAGNGGRRTTIRKKIKTEDYFLQFQNCIMTDSYNKSIPDEYKFTSIEQRLALVQGLLDTDGSISPCGRRYNIRFTNTSKKLVDDLREVLWSLGFSSSISVDNRSNKYTNKVCYTLNINIPNEEKYLLFRLLRKKRIAEEAKDYHKRKNYNKINIVSIEKLDRTADMTCIYINDPNHLYLTEQYIPTHNTTLVKYIIQSLPNINPETDVCFTSFTGKATQVLHSKGNSNVSTLHKLLYKHQMMPNGKFKRVKVSKLDYKVIVVDEVSMVPTELLNDLFSHEVYIIALGDPGQLPPIDKNQDNGLLNTPHIFLDEIMRQAAESEIIQLTMKIRNGEPIPYFKGREVMVLNKKELNEGMLAWADMTLCATNKTRNILNTTIRTMKGYKKPIVEGEKLICLQNYWQHIAVDGETPLINGTIGTIDHIFEQNFYPPKWIGIKDNKIPILSANFISENNDNFGIVDIDKTAIIDGQSYLTPQQNFKLFKNPRTMNLIPLNFTYGYCLTGWKAQGSSWKKVLVYEENFPFDKEERKKFLYTACTRAEQKLVWIR